MKNLENRSNKTFSNIKLRKTYLYYNLFMSNKISVRVSAVSDKKLKLPVIKTPNSLKADWNKTTPRVKIANFNLISILSIIYIYSGLYFFNFGKKAFTFFL